ncbi:hypothetical protein CEXT_171091 [Caerostris extrusa]|uniref:Uncharacterized protein n=1 Tax=Caerostris extrusa TaxID=172846 RepID=A0AAV4XVH3_CAEEX|nr:hypothetical protein CEXT_171091 [Caerostris extrusa]
MYTHDVRIGDNPFLEVDGTAVAVPGVSRQRDPAEIFLGVQGPVGGTRNWLLAKKRCTIPSEDELLPWTVGCYSLRLACNIGLNLNVRP